MDLSIKGAEHKRRISFFFIGEANNVYPLTTDTIPPARKFSSYFVNSENKIRLQAFLLDESYDIAGKYQKKIYYTFKESKEN